MEENCLKMILIGEINMNKPLSDKKWWAKVLVIMAISPIKIGIEVALTEQIEWIFNSLKKQIFK